jgi:glycosyltransferase involved in cell wall biosynthesis
MASGVPVVVSADEEYVASLREDGVCADAPRTAMAMAAAVSDVLGGRHRGLGAGGRAYAEAHWSVDTMIARCLGLLEHLARARRGPG